MVRLENFHQYLGLFKGHTERYRHIRVVLTGRDGAGKTTLCRRLKNEYVDIKTRQPTVGASIDPSWFTIDLQDKIWDHDDNQLPTNVMQNRLGATMRSQQQTVVYERSTTRSYDNTPQDDAEIEAVLSASKSTSPDRAYLSLWDMGGHSAFQASHSVFFSSHGVYLLVFRLTDFLRDALETDRLKKWIRLIGTFSSVELNAPKLRTHAPPIIFVGTFLDELKRTTHDYDKQIVAITQSISKFPELSDLHFVRFCTVDNSLGNKEADLKKLRDLIIQSAEHQDQWDRPLPTTWLKLELDIFKKREKGTKILTLAEVIKMNKSSIAPLADEDEIMLALEYLHCTRSVIYFREFKHVVVDPQWLADFFSNFVTEECFLPKDDILLTRDLALYITKGELTQAIIDGLLGLKKNQAFLPFRSVLFALMEKFGLIVKLELSGSLTGQPHCTYSYTIPSKLMELQDINDIKDRMISLKQKQYPVSKTLCMVFGCYMPDELFQRIFASVLRKYKPGSLPIRYEQERTCENTTDSLNCLYNGFGCLKVNDLCEMILSMHVERSTIALTVFSTTESRLPSDSGRHVRLSVEHIINETLKMSSQQHFQFTHHLHCSSYLGSYDTPVHLYGVINSERGVPCKDGECHGKHRLAKNDAIYWGIKEGSGNSHEDDNTSRIGIDSTIFNRRPMPQELGRLSRLIEASRCDILFVELGLPLPEVEQAKCEARSLAGITAITKMFLKWTNTYPNQTLLDIKEAMEAVDMATDRINEVLEMDEDLADQDIVPIDIWTRAPSDKEIRRIVPNIGNTFYNLCLELGLSPPIIEQHEIGHPITFQSRMCALLQCWVDEFQTDATIGKLLTAMKVCRIDWYTTAQILSQESDASEASEDHASWFKCGIL
ncbi:uncharacterized protein [Argopecten irradians]|uniref:uncharacterized protein n=1 Tax=Argopecten irradians TaxID=31199 RepID=UPI00371D353B